jgi:hypothetical protein
MAPVRMSVSTDASSTRARRSGLRIEQRQHRKLRRQGALPVVDEVADHLDAGDADGPHDAAQGR